MGALTSVSCVAQSPFQHLFVEGEVKLKRLLSVFDEEPPKKEHQPVSGEMFFEQLGGPLPASQQQDEIAVSLPCRQHHLIWFLLKLLPDEEPQQSLAAGETGFRVQGQQSRVYCASVDCRVQDPGSRF